MLLLFLGDGTTPPVTPPVEESTTGGSWWTLLDIAREHREWAADARLRGLQACPYDGEPLTTGAPQGPAPRHCGFCGRSYT